MGKNKKSEKAPVVKEPVVLSAEEEATLAEVAKTDPAKAATLRKMLSAKSRSRRTSEESILANPKYSHAIPGTLMFDPAAGKQSIEIRCTQDGCDQTRRVFTSDLFQVRVCEEHKAAQRKAARDNAKKMLADFKASQLGKKSETVNA